MTDLGDVLKQVAAYTGLNYGELLSYSFDDLHGGVDTGLPSGSIFRAEGQVLYGIIRTLKPAHIIEVGTFYGASALHLLEGVRQNGQGTVHSIDPWEGAGRYVPEHMASQWKRYAMTGQHWIEQHANRRYAHPVLVFEDAEHQYSVVRDILGAMLSLKPDLVISHDIGHPDVGPNVKRAWDEIFGQDNYLTVMPGSTDCGLAIWRPA